MTEFRTEFEAVAMAELLSEFGETVTYIGRGAPREITAIIDREPLQGLDVGDGVAPLAVMRVSPDPDMENTDADLPDFGGIDPEELVVGEDEIRYAQNIDGEEANHTIQRRLHNAGGFIQFEVR
jgi:hypothetical protein